MILEYERVLFIYNGEWASVIFHFDLLSYFSRATMVDQKSWYKNQKFWVNSLGDQLEKLK